MRALTHTGINKDIGRHHAKQLSKVSDNDGDHCTLRQKRRKMGKVVNAHCTHLFQGSMAIKDGISKSHTTPRICRLGASVQKHAITCDKEAMPDRGADVSK